MKKTVYISFMKKKWDLIIEVGIVLPLLVLLTAMALYFGEEWGDRGTLYLVISAALLVLAVLMIFEYAVNGLYITKKGSVIFIPDFRVVWVKRSDLQRVSVNLSEDATGVYYARVKLVYSDGDSFVKDYGDKIYKERNNAGRRVGRSSHLTMKEINSLPQKLEGIDFVNITVIDKQGRIAQQYLGVK